MKGIVFNYLEEFVDLNLGEFYWMQMLDKIGLNNKERIYISPETYDDKDLFSIVKHVCESNNLNEEEIIISFGEHLASGFSRDYNAFFESCKNSIEFLMTVHDVIHVEVKKIYENATPPDFEYELIDKYTLKMRYKSKRMLIPLIKGMLKGVGDFYNETIKVVDIKRLTNEIIPTFDILLDVRRS